MCLFCEVQIRREKTLLHQWSLMSPCCDWVSSQIKDINFPSFSITCVFPQSLFCLCRQHIFKYRPAVWLVSVLSVRCQTHLGAVWLAIRTHCGSRSRLSYYCDDCCGAIFENWSGLFCGGRIGSVSPGGPEAVGWFHHMLASLSHSRSDSVWQRSSILINLIISCWKKKLFSSLSLFFLPQCVCLMWPLILMLVTICPHHLSH